LRANKKIGSKGIEQGSKIHRPESFLAVVLGFCDVLITRGKEYVANTKTWYLERLI
jgi:hypothetical protein